MSFAESKLFHQRPPLHALRRQHIISAAVHDYAVESVERDGPAADLALAVEGGPVGGDGQHTWRELRGVFSQESSPSFLVKGGDILKEFVFILDDGLQRGSHGY